MATEQCISPFPAEIDRNAFGHWLSGFVDGEGSFELYAGASQFNGYISRHFYAALCINLRDDDAPILEQIQSFFGCGCVTFTPHHSRGKGWAPQACYRVRKIEDVHNVIAPHFRRHPLRAKKRRDLLIWEQGVELIWTATRRPKPGRGIGGGKGTKPRWTPAEQQQFAALVVALKAQRVYQSPQVQIPIAANTEKPTPGLFDEQD